MSEVKDKINEINIENQIWLIYIIIIFASWYSNSLEKKYFLTNDNNYKEQYRQVLTKTFFILTIVYLYFLKSSIDGINNLKTTDSQKKKYLTKLSVLASFLIVISGILFLYIAYLDQDIDVEIAFN